MNFQKQAEGSDPSENTLVERLSGGQGRLAEHGPVRREDTIVTCDTDYVGRVTENSPGCYSSSL